MEMIDREKVIKGLETCRTRVHCKECPYAYDKRADDSYCEAVLHNDVLAMLKEQEAVVRCKDCWKREFDNCPFNEFCGFKPDDDWFCADGVKRDNE